MSITQEIPNDFNNPSEYVAAIGGKNYQVDGPLARGYADALHEIYGKKVDEKTGLALETQANDALYAQIAIRNHLAQDVFDDAQRSDMSLLYGVGKGKTTVTDLIDVTDKIATMTPESKANSAVIFDAMVTNENDGQIADVERIKVHPFEVALEAMCKRHGVSTYNSLSKFMKLHT